MDAIHLNSILAWDMHAGIFLLVLTFLWMSRREGVAFEDTLLTCFDQFKSCIKVTPWYLTDEDDLKKLVAHNLSYREGHFLGLVFYHSS